MNRIGRLGLNRARTSDSRDASNAGIRPWRKCKTCGGKMESAASLKFSPEDPQGSGGERGRMLEVTSGSNRYPPLGRMMLLEQSQGSLA